MELNNAIKSLPIVGKIGTIIVLLVIVAALVVAFG